MFAELVQRSLDDRFLKDFLPDGTFVSVPVKGRDYWYYASAMRDGKRSRRYVGPASDPDVTQRVEDFARLKSNAKNRRLMVSALNRIGLPGPDNFTGNIIEALSRMATKAMIFSYPPRTIPLAIMWSVGKLFPRGDKSPAIEPQPPQKLRAALSEIDNVKLGRKHRVSTGFYISEAQELILK